MEQFAKYVGVQGVLALLVTIFILIFIYQGKLIPDQIWTLLGLSWGFYFAKNGGYVANSAANVLRRKSG